MERQPLLELLSLSIGCGIGFEPLDDSAWKDLFMQAREQAVLGITMQGLDALPRTEGAPLKIYGSWALASETIEARSLDRQKLARSIYGLFSSAGLPCCVLKGPSVARFYPQPLRRQSGDIDIWVPAGRKQLLSFLRGRCKVGAVVYHHCECDISGKPGEVEVHFTPSWMNSPRLNKRLQRYFAKSAAAETACPDPELGFCVTSPQFSFVFGIVHFWRHMLDEGIGLRHLADLYYTALSIPPQSYEEISGQLRDLGLYRLSCALAGALALAFGLSASSLPVPPDTVQGTILLQDMLLSGNFGRSDKALQAQTGSRCEAALAKFRRSMRYMHFCPSDVLCAPLFKLWQFVWRAINHYL